MFHDTNNSLTAHRFSWIIENGPVLESDLCVCHICDIRSCVNPSHLFLGTYKDNTQDMIRKNRQSIPLGERNGHAKLTNSRVLVIREEAIDGISQTQLARLFGVSQRTISDVVNRKLWTHV